MGADRAIHVKDDEANDTDALGAAKILGLRRTFAAVPVARPVAYIGGTGALEIAVRDGNAAATLSVTRGDVVTLLHR